MQIFILGSKNFDSLEFHLKDTLLELGHEVIHLDIADIIPLSYKLNYHMIKYLAFYDDYIFKIIANRIIKRNPDLVICTYRFINPNCIRKIKKELVGTPVIHINPDALTTFEYQQIFASPYDAFYTKDPYIVSFD